MNSEKDLEDLFAACFLGIKYDSNHLCMTGLPCADLPIGRVVQITTCITGSNGFHPFQTLVNGLDAPETASAENDCFRFVYFVGIHCGTIRLKIKCNGIHAVAFPGREWTIVKEMTEVAAASSAQCLCAVHAKTMVFVKSNTVGIYLFEEARPATLAGKFGI